MDIREEDEDEVEDEDDDNDDDESAMKYLSDNNLWKLKWKFMKI